MKKYVKIIGLLLIFVLMILLIRSCFGGSDDGLELLLHGGAAAVVGVRDDVHIRVLIHQLQYNVFYSLIFHLSC